MIAAAALLAAGVAASVATEAREGQPAAGLPRTGELQLEARLHAEDRGPDASAALDYTPRLLLVRGRSADVLHRARLQLGLRASPTASLTLEEQATYGRQDLSPLAAQGPAVPVVQLPVRFVDVAGTTTALRFADHPSRRFRWSATASYAWGGGLDQRTRGLVPQTRQPGAAAEAGWALSHLDQLALAGEARLLRSDNGSASSIANATAGLSHAFSRWTSASVAAGVGWTQTQLSPLAQSVWGVLPSLEASLRGEQPVRGQRAAASLRASVKPALDPLTGTAFTLATIGVDLAWDVPRIVQIAARGGFSRVLQGALDGSQTVNAELLAGVPVRHDLLVGAAFRAADVRPRGPGSLAAGTGLQWAALAHLRWDWKSAL